MLLKIHLINQLAFIIRTPHLLKIHFCTIHLSNYHPQTLEPKINASPHTAKNPHQLPTRIQLYHVIKRKNQQILRFNKQ